MFPVRYFPAEYFPPRYWAKVGNLPPPPPPPPPALDLPLLNSPAEIVRELLVDAIQSGECDDFPGQWAYFVSNEPSTPDNAITCYDTTEKYDGRIMISGATAIHYGIQIRIRAIDHPTGGNKAFCIKKQLAENFFRNTVSLHVPSLGVSASYFVQCFSNLRIIYLGRDAPRSQRVLFVINGFVSVRRTA